MNVQRNKDIKSRPSGMSTLGYDSIDMPARLQVGNAVTTPVGSVTFDAALLSVVWNVRILARKMGVGS